MVSCQIRRIAAERILPDQRLTIPPGAGQDQIDMRPWHPGGKAFRIDRRQHQPKDTLSGRFEPRDPGDDALRLAHHSAAWTVARARASSAAYLRTSQV
jgi:hypothetical protein